MPAGKKRQKKCDNDIDTSDNPPACKPVKDQSSKNCPCITTEDVNELIQQRMDEVFSEQFEKLKDKLVTVMANKISCLVEENNSLKLEIQQLRESSIQTSDILNEDKQKLDKKARHLEQEINQIKNESNKFKVAIDDTEQLMKKKNLRIVGLQEDEMETDNMKERLVEVSKSSLHVQSITVNDFDEVYRLGKKQKDEPRQVMVHFKTIEARNAFYKGRRNLYDEANKISKSGIYINEDLTSYRQRLYTH